MDNRRVFISYCSENLSEAVVLARWLRKRGYEPIYDREGLRERAGESWKQWVDDAIDCAGRMVSLWTPAAVANDVEVSAGGTARYFRHEWDIGSRLARSSRRRGFLVPLAFVPHSMLPAEVRNTMHLASGHDWVALAAMFPTLGDAARRDRLAHVSPWVYALVLALAVGAGVALTWAPANWRWVASGGALAMAMAVLVWTLWPRSRLAAHVDEVRDRLQGEAFRVPRDADRDAVLTNCERHGLVHLVGWSGCGKSDLIEHQLRPRLPAGWIPLVIRDWGDGDEGTLRLRLCDVLDRASVKAGLGPQSPPGWGDVAERLDRLARAGRTPLVVLDQFDEYEISAGRQTWDRSAGAFWPLLAERVADGRLRCLIASRRTVASPIGALAAVRPRTVPLGGMSAESVDARVQAFMAPLMTYPTLGWPTLWARVRETIGRTNSIVPADLHLVMSGLVSLDSLTPRALDRRGGLPALTRDSVALRLAKAVRQAGLDDGVVAAVLGRMIGPADVATPASLAELGAAVVEETGRVVESSRLRALVTELFEARLVRLVLGIDGASRWTLDHDTLAQPLRAHVATSRRLWHQWDRALRAAAAGRGWAARLPLSILARLAWDRLRRGRRRGERGGESRWATGVVLATSVAPTALAAALALGVALAVGAGWQHQRAVEVAELGDRALAAVDAAAERAVGSAHDEEALRPLLAELRALSPIEAGQVLTRLLDRPRGTRLDVQRRMADALVGEGPGRRRVILMAGAGRLFGSLWSPLHTHALTLLGDDPRAAAWLTLRSSSGSPQHERRVELALEAYDTDALMTWLDALMSCRGLSSRSSRGLPTGVRRLLAARAATDRSVSARASGAVVRWVEAAAGSRHPGRCTDVVLDAVSSMGGVLPDEGWSSWWKAWWDRGPVLDLSLLPPSLTPGEALERSLTGVRILESSSGSGGLRARTEAKLEAAFTALYEQMSPGEIRTAWTAWAASPSSGGLRAARSDSREANTMSLCSSLGPALGALPIAARPGVAEALLDALSQPRSTDHIAPLTAAIAQFPEVTTALPIERWFAPLLDADANSCLETSAVAYGRAVGDTQLEAALDGLAAMRHARDVPLRLVLIARLATRAPNEASQRFAARVGGALPSIHWLPMFDDVDWTASEGAALGRLLAQHLDVAQPSVWFETFLATCHHWDRGVRDRVSEALLARDAERLGLSGRRFTEVVRCLHPEVARQVLVEQITFDVQVRAMYSLSGLCNLNFDQGSAPLPTATEVMIAEWVEALSDPDDAVDSPIWCALDLLDPDGAPAARVRDVLLASLDQTAAPSPSAPKSLPNLYKALELVDRAQEPAATRGLARRICGESFVVRARSRGRDPYAGVDAATRDLLHDEARTVLTTWGWPYVSFGSTASCVELLVSTASGQPWDVRRHMLDEVLSSEHRRALIPALARLGPGSADDPARLEAFEARALEVLRQRPDSTELPIDGAEALPARVWKRLAAAPFITPALARRLRRRAAPPSTP